MRRFGWITAVLVVSPGCGDAPPPVLNVPGPPAPAVSSFDPARCGAIAGRVRWAGPAPHVPPIEVDRFNAARTRVEHVQRDNPHAPRISAEGALAGAVMFLRGVDPATARPWDHAPVTLEMHDERPMVRQGGAPAGLIGFVRRGDVVTLVSRQPLPHAIRARGAAFFTLTLPKPDVLRSRPLNEIGHVELTSATGHMAVRGHVFVDEHPYYTLTDADGRFTLSGVPAGAYELVCWRPDWRIERQERDPETLLRVRLTFMPAKETTVEATVRCGESTTVMIDVD
jgi:hypothetical protein